MEYNLDPKIINEILKQRPDLSYDEIEKLVSKKMMELHISPKTALYLITLELGVKLGSKIVDYMEISKLRGGLNRIRVIGRILWLKNEEYFKSPIFGERSYVRGGIGDNTGIANIIFWGYTLEKLEELGIIPGVIVDINGVSTKKSLAGDIEIHVSENANIKIDFEKNGSYPHIKDYLVKLDDVDLSTNKINTYGKVLTRISSRKYTREEREGTVASFLLGSGNKAIKVVLWNKAVEEYNWIKPGDTIMIFNGRIKIDMRGEPEIHIGRASHIDYLPGVSIEILYHESTLADIDNGYNLKKIDLRIVAKGKERINIRTGVRSLGLYVVDTTADATLVLIGDNVVDIGKKISEGDIIRIGGFRGAKRADQIFIFCDDSSNILINPKDAKPLPLPSIRFKNGDELSITDRVINIEGTVVKEPSLITPASPLIQDQYEFIIEDKKGNPINISYRGDITLYTDETIHVGDKIRISAGFLDASSLIGTVNIPIIRLRAYSKIMKIT